MHEFHLDRFKFLNNPGASSNPSSSQHSLRFSVGNNLIENSSKKTLVARFGVHFSSEVFGVFEQKLIFDFGNRSVLSRKIKVSVVSKEILPNEEMLVKRCRIVDWSLDSVEVVKCDDLLYLDEEGLCDLYPIPDVHPAPSEIPEFSSETYCESWHNILYTEEEYIKKEIARSVIFYLMKIYQQ